MSTPDSAPNSTPTEWLSLRSLAKAIGVDAGQLSKESGRPGFPGHATADGTLYDAAEVARWRQANVRTKKSARAHAAMPAVDRPSPPAMAPGHHPSPNPGKPSTPSPHPRDRTEELAEDEPLLAVLRSGNGSALEISRAAMQLAARRVARAHHEDRLGPNDFEGLKKALQELRTAEAGYIELEESRRGLIPRDEVKAIIADCCGRLVRVLSSLENSIAMELSIWLADPKTAAMPAEERNRLVRGYVAKVTREARTMEADDVERLINTPRVE